MQAIRAEVQRLDQKLSARPETVAMMIAGAAGQYDAVIGVTAIPATLALFLSVIGIYGLTAFAAALRTHEIGVRLALGASRGQIVALFFWSLRWPFGVGVVGGSVCAAIGVAVLNSTSVLSNVSVSRAVHVRRLRRGAAGDGEYRHADAGGSRGAPRTMVDVAKPLRHPRRRLRVESQLSTFFLDTPPFRKSIQARCVRDLDFAGAVRANDEQLVSPGAQDSVKHDRLAVE